MSKYRPVEIIIADDHLLIREGFAAMFHNLEEYKIVAYVKDGVELIKQARALKPDIIITDVKMPKMDGITAARQITREFPDIGIVAITTFDEINLVYEMQAAGVKVYLLKDSDKDEIVKGIKAAKLGENFYCKTMQAKLEKLQGYKPTQYKLPQRQEFNIKELQILRLLCNEYKNTDIAAELKIGKRTVEGHRLKLFEKTNCKNVAGLVKYAIEHNLIKNE